MKTTIYSYLCRYWLTCKIIFVTRIFKDTKCHNKNTSYNSQSLLVIIILLLRLTIINHLHTKILHIFFNSLYLCDGDQNQKNPNRSKLFQSNGPFQDPRILSFLSMAGSLSPTVILVFDRTYLLISLSKSVHGKRFTQCNCFIDDRKT